MIPRFAVRHPVTVLMIFAAAALLGGLALRELPVDLLPDLDAPRIAVLLESGDRPPEELEDAYGRFLEASLATLPGVRSVRTVSSTGRVLASVEYEWDADMDFALLDVQKQVAPLATDLDVDSLVVRRFDPSEDPVVVLALAPERSDRAPSDEDLDRLRRLAEDRISRALERVPGVASVQVAGGREREVRVTVERHRLAAHGLRFEQVAAALAQGNAEAPGGTIEDRGTVHVIKGLGKFEDLDDVANLPLSLVRRSEGSESGPARPLRLSEVADVSWASAPVRGLVTVDGREGVSLSAFKEAGSNTVAVSDRIEEAVEGLREELPGLRLVRVSDQAGFIREAIRQVQWAAVAGVVLAVLVLVAFLRSLRAVALVGLAIPLSIVATFALMAVSDLSLNLMTLGGLALGAGMMIDNAIVVLEATFRHLEEGADPFEAAERGASEVSAAIVAATITTCVVFLPVTFLHGIAAELFSDLAFTVVFALACSLAVALLLIPAAAARLFAGAEHRPRRVGARAPRYGRLLGGALRRPFLILLAAAGAVAGSAALVPGIGLEFLPTSDPGEITARLLMPEGTRVTVTAEAARRLEDSVRRAAPGAVDVALAELGESVREQVALTDEIPAEHRGLLRLALAPRERRELTTEQVMAMLDEAAENVSGLALRFEPTDPVMGRLAERGPPVRVEVRGQDLEAVERGSSQVAGALRRVPSLYAVRSSYEDRRAEVRLDIDRTVAAGLGLDPDDIAQQLRRQLGAESTTTFRKEGEERDVVLRGPERSLRDLPLLVLDSPSEEPVRLGDIARVSVQSSPARIERTLGTRMGVVTAQLVEGATLGEASTDIERALDAVQLPPGTRAAIAGAETARRSSFQELLLAVGLAVLLVYMVLASLFESLVHPFTILLTLPTAGVGVVVALALTGTPFSVPALLGAVMLAGIAVNNGILLVDLTGRLRAEGLERREALVAAATLRLRPILMTSLTTILAMLPLALGESVLGAVPGLAGWGEGSELRAPMALAVIGGLTASTLLTLLVVPAAYELLDRLRPAARPARDAAGAPAPGEASP